MIQLFVPENVLHPTNSPRDIQIVGPSACIDLDTLEAYDLVEQLTQALERLRATQEVTP